MEPKCCGIFHTPIKPRKDSSLSYDESEDLSFQVSKLEDLIKGTVRMIYLVNLENKMNNIEENMKRITKLMQNPKENFSKGDDVS